MNKDEKNRKIAELLGHRVTSTGNIMWMPEGSIAPMLDFYSDDSANAMLLEAMGSAGVRLQFETHSRTKVWSVWVYIPRGTSGMSVLDEMAIDPDRRTAICEAFLKWKKKS